MTRSTRTQQNSLQKQMTPAAVLSRYGVLIAFAIMLIFLSFATSTFLTPKNLINVVR